MKTEIIQFREIAITHVTSDEIIINSTQDALNIMGDAFANGSTKIMIHEENIIPAFFDLKSGIAGDILQKFSTYNLQLAIVGDFSKYSSKSLQDFIFESNKYGRINFVKSVEEGKEKLSLN